MIEWRIAGQKLETVTIVGKPLPQFSSWILHCVKEWLTMSAGERCIDDHGPVYGFAHARRPLWKAVVQLWWFPCGDADAVTSIVLDPLFMPYQNLQAAYMMYCYAGGTKLRYG